MVAAVTAVVALGLSFVDVGLLAGSSPAGQGFLLVVLQGAFVVAASLGALGLVESGMPAWRRAVAVGRRRAGDRGAGRRTALVPGRR